VPQLAELISSNGETTNPARNLPSKKIAECRLGASGQQAVEKRYAIMLASSAGEFVGQIADVYPVGNDGSVITKDREGTLWKGDKIWIGVRDADTWKIRMEYVN
jgi:hypothetical protein